MLKETEQDLFTSVVRNSEDAIIVHGLDGLIHHWNRGAESLFGYADAQALGSSIELLIEPTEYRRYENYVAALLDGRVEHAPEIRGVTRQGRHPDLWLNASVLHDRAGNAVAIAATFRDITDKKSIEHKLIALIESTPDPFIIVEGDGRIQRVNRQAEVLFGYSREELIGQSFKMLVPERYRAQHDLYTRNYQVKPAMRQMGSGLELWCLPRSGEEIPVEIGLSPVVARDETTIMVRFRDIRIQKREQAVLNEARQKADEANRTKTRFLAAASHDLRQPLQSISMHLGILAGELKAADKERVLEQARTALDTTNKLLNALLNITKLESGKVQPEIDSFPISEVLGRVYNTERLQAKENAQRFSFRTSSAVVTSDPALLEQLVTNLVANALRYTPQGGHILLGCRRLPGQLKVQVLDDGPGIASQELDSIFDEYRQLETTQRHSGRGLGLGLSIVKLIAELLGLQLEVRSVPGRGSCFSVLVPLAQEKPRPRHKPAVDREKVREITGSLLLVDDDAAVLDSTSMFLELSGFTVHAALNSVEALALLERHVPDLVVTDYGLGEAINGIELLERMRKVLRKKVPAIVISGDISLQRRYDSKKAKFDIIAKPIDAQQLLELVRKRLS